jgi:hypothetical protein
MTDTASALQNFSVIYQLICILSFVICKLKIHRQIKNEKGRKKEGRRE